MHDQPGHKPVDHRPPPRNPLAHTIAACAPVFRGDRDHPPRLSFTDAGAPVADGGTVNAGDTLTVSVSWPGKAPVSRLDTCAEAIVPQGGHIQWAQEHTVTAPAVITSPSTFSLAVPAYVGDQLCFRTVLAQGPGPPERSSRECLRISMSAVLPESPSPILLPGSALVMAGGFLLVRRGRRRRKAAP